MSKHFLAIEIRTEQFPPPDLQLLPMMTIMQDAHGNYFFATGIETIKTAIIDSLPHLDSNFLYPLSFQVQIVPGDMLDALMASSTETRTPGLRRRITKQD